ncbi:uncharacterized protein PAF06_012250 [Gastrophryne carolinensis]
MADMAPALTGAAQEAPHRLKLNARSGLLILNGGDKSRPALDDVRLNEAPGPNGGRREVRPGALGKLHRLAGVRPLHGVRPMERTGTVPGPGERMGAGNRTGDALGPGERLRASLVPGERLGAALGPGERMGTSNRTGAASGPEVGMGSGNRTGAVLGPGERTGAGNRIGGALVAGHRPGTGEKTGAALGPGEKTGAALGPGEKTGAALGPGEKTGAALGPGEKTGAALGPGEKTGAALGPGEKTGAALGPGEKTGAALGPGEKTGAALGPGEKTGAALGPGEKTGAALGPGEKTGAALGPGEKTGAALWPGEKTGAALWPAGRMGTTPGPGNGTVSLGPKARLKAPQGPGERISAVVGLKRSCDGLLAPERIMNTSGPSTCPAPQDASGSSSLDSALRPAVTQSSSAEAMERLKDMPQNTLEDLSGRTLGPTAHSAPCPLAAQDLVAKPLEGRGEISGILGPSTHLDSAHGSLSTAQNASLDCVPPSQDATPGPKVYCALRTAQMSSRQQELGARARRLCRRLQVIQAKQVARHVRQQLSGLVELLSEHGPAGLPGSPHVELDRLACSSTARLRAAQGGFDSDATESSSGGESDAEEAVGSSEQERPEEEPSQAQGSNRHVEWRWAVERAAIICRWTWLQAQVSDLEFRIRQQTEFYKQIRSTKGGVVLGETVPCEDSTAQQTAGSSVVLNARDNRVPLSSSFQTTVKTTSGGEPCDSLPNTPTPSTKVSDKQCSRLTQSVKNVVCQNPATPVCDSTGAQKSSRQVNGLVNCVRSSISCNGSAANYDPDGLLGKKRRTDVVSISSALSDSTCVAARARPLRGHKKRHLVRCSEVSSLSRKPQKQPSTRCGCEPPTTCIICECKTYAKNPHPSTVTLNESIALMDPCYHPILSFPYDIPLHLHFESLLKEDRQFRLSHKLKILKLSQLGKKPLDRVRRDSFCQSSEITGRSVFREDKQYRGVTSPSIQMSSPFTPRPNPTAHQPLSLSESTLSSVSQQNSSSVALKRKRFENSYDIDNIVIPMSLVAASRVEKLQYKEILTPSWRLLDCTEKNTLEEDPQLEDLSDETYQVRHSKYEDLERSRWDSWSSVAPQRRGSRSSNKSEGRWTPQPSSNSQGSQQNASPDIRYHTFNDGPLSLSASADNLEPYSTVQCLTVQSRTRLLSWSEDTRSSTPEIQDDEEQTVQPWEHRFFPLTDRDYHTLQDLPETPNRGRTKQHSDSLWQNLNNPSVQTESIDSSMSTEHLTPTSKESPLPNSISVVRVRAHSGDKIASLEYLPARLVNKR